MKALRYSLAAMLCFFAIQSIAQKKEDARKMMSCTFKMPHKSTALDNDTSANGKRGLLDNYYLWNAGTTLKVKLLSGSERMRNAVMEAAKEWEKFANIHFEFVDYGPTNIRVLLGEGLGHNSSLGTQCNSVPQDQQTMNLDTTDFIWSGQFNGMYAKGVAMHELGHAIGFLHEHFNPISGIKWNKEAVYKDLMASQGWTKEEIDYNLFQTYAVSYTNGTKYDAKSIMHYYIKPNWTLDGFSVKTNSVLSDGDKQLAAIAYPPEGVDRTREVPRFTISDFEKAGVMDNTTKGGFSYYPTFNISTEGRQGKVVFIMYILDKDYNFIPHPSDPANSIVGTSQMFTLPAGKKYTVNKGVKDVEFFIPYSALPLQTGKNEFNVYFVAKLIDGDEVKYLMRSNPVAFTKVVTGTSNTPTGGSKTKPAPKTGGSKTGGKKS